MASRPKQAFQTTLQSDLQARVDRINAWLDRMRTYPPRPDENGRFEWGFEDLATSRDLYEISLNMLQLDQRGQSGRHALAVRLHSAMAKNQAIVDARVAAILNDETLRTRQRILRYPAFDHERAAPGLLYDARACLNLNLFLGGTHFIPGIRQCLTLWSERAKREGELSYRRDFLGAGADKQRLNTLASFLARSYQKGNGAVITTLSGIFQTQIDDALATKQPGTDTGAMSIGRMPVRDFRKITSTLERHNIPPWDPAYLRTRIHYAHMLEDAYRYKWHNRNYRSGTNLPDNPDLVMRTAIEAGYTTTLFDLGEPDRALEDLVQTARKAYQSLERGQEETPPDQLRQDLQDRARSFPRNRPDFRPRGEPAP